MENKKISKKIKDSLRLIKAFKNKEMLFISDEAGNALKEHIKMYDHAVKLRNEISKLQASLKFKKKEIASVVKELSKNRKITKKGLKKSKKSTGPLTAFKSNGKPAAKPVIARRRKVDPTKTAAKPVITQRIRKVDSTKKAAKPAIAQRRRKVDPTKKAAKPRVKTTVKEVKPSGTEVKPSGVTIA